MKRFYVCQGGLAKGPYTIDELKKRGLNYSDPIWCPGFQECKPAGTIIELRELFYPEQNNNTVYFDGSIARQDYVIYQRELHKYNSLLVAAMIGAGGLGIYFLLTLL